MLYNKPLFSERHLDLLRDLHKAVRDFCGMVAAVGCSSFALPALLPAVRVKMKLFGSNWINADIINTAIRSCCVSIWKVS